MVFKKILDLLPPPRILDIPSFSIAVSDRNIRCVLLRKNNSNLELVRYSEYPVPEGVVSGGQIDNMDEFSKILKKIKIEYKLDYVRVSILEEKAYIFKTEIPIVKRKEVCDAIEFTLEENVPVPANELVFDYAVVRQTNENLDVVVVALPTKNIEDYIKALEMADLKLMSLEVESQAISQAIVSQDEKETKMINYFNGDKMSVYIVSNSIVHFVSTNSIRGDIKENIPFVSQEIKKIHSYWKSLDGNSKDPKKDISTVLVCGDFVSEDILSQISVNTKLPIVLANVWTNVYNLDKFIPNIAFEKSLAYAPAIGLSIPRDILI